MHPQFRVGAAAGLLALGLVLLPPAPARAQRPKAESKVLYVMPHYARATADFASDVANLRARFGEGRYVRLGFTNFLDVTMDGAGMDPANAAAIRASLAATIARMDSLVDRGRTHNVPVNLAILTAARSARDRLQEEAERSDRRNASWYSSNASADGWVTYSRYARRFRAVFEAHIRELGGALANRMAKYPSIVVAASGDGESELSYERSPIIDPAYTVATAELADYSPFAVAEFRDWLRNGGLYAPGQAFAGQGYENAARYQGDASPAVDSNGDGRTLNGDFGTSFSTWDLRHFNWNLSDAQAPDPNAIPASVYQAGGFNPLPAQIPGGFDPPRAQQSGQPWWEVWNLFRQVMVWRHNVDFARWITTTLDAETRTTVPVSRWFSHQIPADYLFGHSPTNQDYRLITSASPYWTGDISPYGGLGITAFNVNLGGDNFALTARNVVPQIAARGVRWSIVEWNPSVPVSNALGVYDEEMRLIERYRPALVAPFGWGDPFYQLQNTPFEVALRDMIQRIKDTPPSSGSDGPAIAPIFLEPGRILGPRPLGEAWPRRRSNRRW